MNKQILRIFYNNTEILSTFNAKQSCVPIKSYNVARNINGQAIVDALSYCNKYKIIITSYDPPQMDKLIIGAEYKIFSVVHFTRLNVETVQYVPDSLHKTQYGTTYKPIFTAFLTHYRVDNGIWTLEFEET